MQNKNAAAPKADTTAAPTLNPAPTPSSGATIQPARDGPHCGHGDIESDRPWVHFAEVVARGPARQAAGPKPGDDRHRVFPGGRGIPDAGYTPRRAIVCTLPHGARRARTLAVRGLRLAQPAGPPIDADARLTHVSRATAIYMEASSQRSRRPVRATRRACGCEGRLSPASRAVKKNAARLYDWNSTARGANDGWRCGACELC